MRLIGTAIVTLAALAGGPAYAANLLVNGSFEVPTTSTTTPFGWTNIGHSDGTISYSIGPVPAYDGNYFYDLGGFGDPSGPVGDGIQQAVTTTVGRTYLLTFGLSSEDVRGDSDLTVNIGNFSTVFSQTSGGTFFRKGFTTRSLSYVATSTSTLISFIETRNTSGGNNDPLIDGVSFAAAGVPEPATWSLMIVGFGLIGRTLRRARAMSAQPT